jgi:hypothetical protein
VANSAESFAAGFLKPKPISTRKIIPAALHKKDIEEVVRATVAQGPFSMWQSNWDYAVLGERADPRGRKSGGGPGVTNPR